MEFGNRPMILHQVESLAAAGVTDIVLAVNYRPDVMVSALKKYEEQYGVNIEFSVESEPLGTAGPLKLAEKILASRTTLAGERKQVTVLFADIWGYTTISSGMPPMQLMTLLRELLRMFEKAIFANGGTLDKFLGDGLMATFGTPKAGPRDAANALSCACAMADSIARWNRKRRENGLKPMYLGIGLHHGDVVLGDIGSERRMEFAVIGDTVNVASRVQEMTRALNIAVLASDDVVKAARLEAGDAAVREFGDSGEHELRGRAGKIRLWSRAAER